MTSTSSAASGDVTRLLRAYSEGDAARFDEVIPIVYGELKRLAHAQLGKSSRRGSLQTTMLVHEAYEKLLLGKTQHPADRRHFFAIASRAMRQVVVDTWRAENTAKRGGGGVELAAVTRELVDINNPADLVRLDQSITRLAQASPELAELIDLSCFAGLSNDEIAELQQTTLRTVQRNLVKARAWLGQFLDEPDA